MTYFAGPEETIAHNLTYFCDPILHKNKRATGKVHAVRWSLHGSMFYLLPMLSETGQSAGIKIGTLIRSQKR